MVKTGLIRKACAAILRSNITGEIRLNDVQADS